MEEEIKYLIENAIESSCLDFKEKMYPKKGTTDLLKDILAMANSSHPGKKYIVMGIKDSIGGDRVVTGVSPDQIIDSASYQQFILNNIEPDLDLDLYYTDYQDKKIAVLILDNTIDKPYLTKKKSAGVYEGLCLIRKGSTNSIANRADFDKIYQQKDGQFELRILENRLRAVRPKDGTALLDISIRNLTSNPVTIIAGRLIIIDSDKKERAYLTVYGLEKEMGADFRMEIAPKREFSGDLHLGFGSNDCFRLGLDQYGYTNELFEFILQFRDSCENEYTVSVKNATVFARGEFLRKVGKKSIL